MKDWVNSYSMQKLQVVHLYLHPIFNLKEVQELEVKLLVRLLCLKVAV